MQRPKTEEMLQAFDFWYDREAYLKKGIALEGKNNILETGGLAKCLGYSTTTLFSHTDNSQATTSINLGVTFRWRKVFCLIYKSKTHLKGPQITKFGSAAKEKKNNDGLLKPRGASERKITPFTLSHYTVARGLRRNASQGSSSLTKEEL